MTQANFGDVYTSLRTSSPGAFRDRDSRIPLLSPPPVPRVPQRNCSQAILLAVTALHVSGAFRDGIGQRQRWKALWGPLRQGMGEISPLVLPGSQSFPEKLLAGYVTGRDESKREWKFVLELDKQKQRWKKFHLLRRLKVHYVVWHQLGKSKRNFWQHSNRCFDNLPRSLKIFLVISKAAQADQVSYRRRVCTWFSTILGYKAKRELYF